MIHVPATANTSTILVVHISIKIGGEYIKYYVKKEIMNLLHENIDVHSRRLIYELTEDGVKYISKLQSHCANMNFSDKIRYDRIFLKFTHKGGE